ncbi:MAG: translesion DNA synthesis-associated protein ImuA [Betaproteobacteria bacterium]|nr:translesion DNA synthesis-associated protein ImuA [Betaproteobacteria bacterium]
MSTPANALPPLPALLNHPALWRGSDLARTRFAGASSGSTALDAELPGGGWPVGALTEILPAHEGIGELRLLGPALAAISEQGQNLVWVAPPYMPYAPALTAAGIDMARLFIVRANSGRDTLWATEQALASNACGAVLAWLPMARTSQAARYPALRRLQLAAERGQSLALLFRPPECERESSPAALRIAVCTADGGLAVRIFKRRGGTLNRTVLLPASPRRRATTAIMPPPHAVRPTLALA